jgi:Pilus formation protein N terminal region
MRLVMTRAGGSPGGIDMRFNSVACRGLAALFAAALVSAIPAHAQKSNVEQKIQPQVDETTQAQPVVKPESNEAEIQVSPGYLRKVEVSQTYSTILIGNPNIVDAQPITDKMFFVKGVKVGNTNIRVLGFNNQELVNYTVIVNALPGYHSVEIYSGKNLANSIIYQCADAGTGCSLPQNNVVKPEDLPRGYVDQNVKQQVDQHNTNVNQ